MRYWASSSPRLSGSRPGRASAGGASGVGAKLEPLSSIASGTASPLREHAREHAARLGARRTRLWVEGLVLLWLLWVYDATTDLAPLRLHTALANARGVFH